MLKKVKADVLGLEPGIYYLYSKEDIDHLFSRINWPNSNIDARAVRAMNTAIRLVLLE